MWEEMEMKLLDLFFVGTVATMFFTLAAYHEGGVAAQKEAKYECKPGVVATVVDERGIFWCVYTNEPDYGKAVHREKGKQT
jgi:hypothetical protein